MSGSRSFKFEGATYYDLLDNSAKLIKISSGCDHFKVPSFVVSPEGEKLEVNSIYKYFLLTESSLFPENRQAREISFDEHSVIEVVPTSLILSSKSRIFLPPKIKRVLTDASVNAKWPKVHLTKDSIFISITESGIIMNHHPLELVHHLIYQSRHRIRETTRTIGNRAFLFCKTLTHVVIPPSVEVIGYGAFSKCSNLQTVSFIRKSSLRKIEDCAFSQTSLSSIVFPSSVEEIDKFSFCECENLTHISFQNDSRLRMIGLHAFSYANIERIEIPSSVEEIYNRTFYDCPRLSDSLLKDKILLGECVSIPAH